MSNREDVQHIAWQNTLDDYVRKVVFSIDDSTVLAATSGGRLYAFHRSTGEERFMRQLHSQAIAAAAIAPVYGHIATGGEDGIFQVTDFATGAVRFRHQEKGQWIEHVAWSSTGEYVAFTCNKQVYIVTAEGHLYDVIVPAYKNCSAIAWHSHSGQLAMAAYGGVTLYNVSTKAVYQHLPCQNGLVSLAWNRADTKICCGAQEAFVQVWPLPFAEGTDMAMSGFTAKVKQLNWHYSDRYLAADCDNIVTVWDFGEQPGNEPSPGMYSGHITTIQALSFQHTGTLLVSGDDGGLVIFWDPVTTQKMVTVVPTGAGITCIAWSADDMCLAAGSTDGQLLLIYPR